MQGDGRTQGAAVYFSVQTRWVRFVGERGVRREQGEGAVQGFRVHGRTCRVFVQEHGTHFNDVHSEERRTRAKSSDVTTISGANKRKHFCKVLINAAYALRAYRLTSHSSVFVRLLSTT
jgi:hypothetical protein